MSFSAIFVILVLVGMLITLALDKMRPGITLFSAAILFMCSGIISSKEAVAGFSNKGMITIAVLFLVSEGIRQSGGLNYIVSVILPKRTRSIPRTLMTLLPASAAVSAFLNNTAVVIIFAPMIKKWAEKMNLPATKFLIPLSYATIIGGLCTLIGTSTNLIVDSMMVEAGFEGFTIFEIGKVGLFIAIAGIIYLIIFSNALLPGERILKKDINRETRREYLYDVIIPDGSPLIGTNVRREKFGELEMMDVTAIKRHGKIIGTKGKTIEIEKHDVLVLAGKSDVLEHILNCPSIRMACLSRDKKVEFAKKAVKQIEVVVAPRFPGCGRTLKEFDFLSHYGAVVMAIHRGGERSTLDMYSHVIREGDTFVLIAENNFTEVWGESSAFYMISETNDFKMPANRRRRIFGLCLLLFMIVGAAIGESHFNKFSGTFDMLYFASITMVIMALTKMFPAKKYTKYISWDILVATASAFAISKAMINSGISDSVAGLIIEVSKNFGAHGALFAIFMIAMVATEVITNNAAAALCFPISVAIAERLGVSPYPFFIAICVAASASFSTPIGYQTNLIVQGIGGYKFKDYLRIGLPLNIITIIISLILIPLIWKF